MSRLRQSHKDAEAAITRLLSLVEQGVMEVEDASLRERVVGLKFRRDELAVEMSGLQKRIAGGEPTITPDKIAASQTSCATSSETDRPISDRLTCDWS